MKARVLIIEDEPELAHLIELYLAKEGIETVIENSAEAAESLIEQNSFDLITLDINLPGKDGFEFLQTLRKTSDVPVIIVSAREEDEDIIMGLGIGADGFVTKPFAPKVLAARIRALLRRAEQSGRGDNIVTYLELEIDPDAHIVKKRDERLSLSVKEFDILLFLVGNRGKSFSAQDIYENVWGNSYGDITSVGVYIQRLRKKIEDNPKEPRILETIHGYGYRVP